MGFALLGALNSSIWKCLVWCTLPPFQDSQVHRVRIARSKATWRNKAYRSTDKQNRIIIVFHLFVAHLASKYFRIASMQLESHVFDIRLERIWDTLSRGISTDSCFKIYNVYVKGACMGVTLQNVKPCESRAKHFGLSQPRNNVRPMWLRPVFRGHTHDVGRRKSLSCLRAAGSQSLIFASL